MIINTDKISTNHKRGEKLITLAGYFTPLMAASIEWAGKVNKLEHPTFHKYFGFVKEHSLFAYGALIFLFWLGTYWTRKGNKVCWEALQVQIDELQSIAFANLQQDSNDSHRVTLFKYKKWCWRRFNWNLYSCFKSIIEGKGPSTGWLVPVLRSGHLSKNTKTVFHVPDEGRNAEGVAGQCWASDYSVHVENLPSLSSASNSENRRKYSTRTNIPLVLVNSYIEDGKELSRSLMAIPVRTASGNRWGVVVLDSQNRTGIDKVETEKAFRTIINTLGVLLEDLA
ncbi:hypothetical protein [Thalassotalea ganghwensis]